MVKKLLIIALTFFIFNLKTHAQKFNFTKVHLSLKAGLNLSSFTDNVGQFDKKSPNFNNSPFAYYENYFRITGLVGIKADYSVGKSFSVAAELLYNGRGAAYRGKNDNVVLIDNNGAQTAYDYFKFQIDYIELPLLAQYSFTKPRANASFLIYGGIAPAITVNTGTKYFYYSNSDGTPVANQSSKSGPLENVNGFNLSPVLGFQFGGKRTLPAQFFADLRFEYSLLPVFNTSSIDGYNFQTNLWTSGFGIGIRF